LRATAHLKAGEDLPVKRSKNEANLVLEQHLKELRLPYISEFRFGLPIGREWRADYFVSIKETLVEIEGSVWTQGRHTRGSGFLKDLEKYNTAAMLGYRLLRFSTQQVLDGTAREFLKTWLCGAAPA
jgi:very-short-patch-repair endonuclease